MSALKPSGKLNIYAITATGLLDELEALARFRRKSGLDATFVYEAIGVVEELLEILDQEDLPTKRAAPAESAEDDDFEDSAIADIIDWKSPPETSKKEAIPFKIASPVMKNTQPEPLPERKSVKFKSRR